MQGFPPFQKNMHSLGRRPAPSKLLHEGATLVTPVPTGRMEAIRGRTSSRASRGGATTVPRQSTSSSRASTGGATTVPRQSTLSLSSSRTSMDGMVPNAATTMREDGRSDSPHILERKKSSCSPPVGQRSGHLLSSSGLQMSNFFPSQFRTEKS